jgi:lysophospholipase L1-like esterase
VVQNLVLPIALIGALVAVLVFVLTRTQDEPKSAAPLTIAVIGDSYTAGYNNRVVWPTLLAQRTGWSVANFALPGAGFASDGQGGYAFPYQAQRAQAVYPQAVLIMSGVTDPGFAGSDAVTEGFVATVNRIKLGGERVFVVGPLWYETPAPPPLQSVSDEIHAAADAAGVPFLNALDPPWLTVELMQPGFSSPTDEGQSVIADKVAAWLRTQVAG